MIRLSLAVGCVVAVVVAVIVSTPGPGYFCGSTYGDGARCLSAGDELLFQSTTLGLDAGAASESRIAEIAGRERALFGGGLSLTLGQSGLWGQSLLYCRSDVCEIKPLEDGPGTFVLERGRLIYWRSLPTDTEMSELSVDDQRRLDTQAARTGGYDCSADWGAGFVCFDEGEVIVDVRVSIAGGEAITPAGSGAQFSEARDRLEFTFGSRAAIYEIQLWMNCVTQRCVLGVSESEGNAGEVLEGSFAVRRDTPR